MSKWNRLTASMIGLAILAMPALSLAGSSDDYEFPIGRVDAQIACVPLPPASTAAGDEEPACLAKFRGVVIRAGDDLKFRLDNGTTRTIHGNSRACRQIPVGDCLIYGLVGYIGASRQFVLRRSHYESTYVDLVSRRTGQVTRLEGFPHVSPNGGQFVTVAASDAWEIDNPIAIYSNTDPPKLVWSFPEPKEYEQYGFDGWEGDSRIKLHTSTAPQIDTNLSRTGDGWVLWRPDGKFSYGINGN